jgi:hypothetical protein
VLVGNVPTGTAQESSSSNESTASSTDPTGTFELTFQPAAGPPGTVISIEITCVEGHVEGQQNFPHGGSVELRPFPEGQPVAAASLGDSQGRTPIGTGGSYEFNPHVTGRFDDRGHGAVALTVPEDAMPGSYSLRFSCYKDDFGLGSGSGRLTFTVLPPGSPTSMFPTATLAATSRSPTSGSAPSDTPDDDSNSTLVVVVTLALIVAAATTGLVARARRQRSFSDQE